MMTTLSAVMIRSLCSRIQFCYPPLMYNEHCFALHCCTYHIHPHDAIHCASPYLRAQVSGFLQRLAVRDSLHRVSQSQTGIWSENMQVPCDGLQSTKKQDRHAAASVVPPRSSNALTLRNPSLQSTQSKQSSVCLLRTPICLRTYQRAQMLHLGTDETATKHLTAKPPIAT